jgi:hypothetical protein
LRRRAYRNTRIETGAAFFDDSDMRSDYALVLVVHQPSMTLMLSARYYFNPSAVHACLRDETDPQAFLVDRLSGNTGNAFYREQRRAIHLLFYAELFMRQRDRCLYVMARCEKREKLLAAYRRLGLRALRTVQHQGKPHWLMCGRLQDCYDQLSAADRAGFLQTLDTHFSDR